MKLQKLLFTEMFQASAHFFCFIAAFAELQTEVIDFTSDLNIIGIPFWDYETYTFKVLFPSYADHPVFHENACQVCYWYDYCEF